MAELGSGPSHLAGVRQSDVHRVPVDWLLVALALGGLVFWLVVAFPFANQNESYRWIPLLSTRSFWSMITTQMPTVNGYRPLAQATAWLLFRLDGHPIYFAEAFNALVALLAWVVVWIAVPQKRLCAVLSLVAGGCFFAGYIWVFHIYGVVYGPMLVAVAACLLHAERRFSLRATLALAAVCAVASLYHPASLPVLAGYLSGYLLSHWLSLSRMSRVVMVCIIAASLLAFIALSGIVAKTGGMTIGFTSFEMLTPRRVLSLAAVGFALITAVTLPMRPRGTWVAVILTIGAGLVFLAAGWPTVLLWVALSACKAALLRRWDLLALLGATLILPLAMSEVGSPSYSIPAVLAATGVVCSGGRPLERLLPVTRAAAALLLTALVVLAVALRVGLSVPVLTAAASPVMAEREKTFQLERIVAWIVTSPQRGATVYLKHSAVAPGVDPSAALDRTNRAPTSDYDLVHYLAWLVPSQGEEGKYLLVTFGGESLPHSVPLYRVTSRHAGTASVWLTRPGPPPRFSP